MSFIEDFCKYILDYLWYFDYIEVRLRGECSGWGRRFEFFILVRLGILFLLILIFCKEIKINN